MKRRFKSFISVIIAVSVIFSFLIVPSSAVDTASVTAFAEGLKTLYESVIGVQDVAIDYLSFMEFPRYDQVDTYDEFIEILNWYNSGGFTGNSGKALLEGLGKYQVFMSGIRNGTPRAVPKADSARNYVYRLYDTVCQCWVVDSYGRFPYLDRDVFNASAGNVPAVKPEGHFVVTSTVQQAKQIKLVGRDELDSILVYCAANYNGTIGVSALTINGQTYYGIRRLVETETRMYDGYWCALDGRPVVYAEPSQQGSSQNWNYDKVQDMTNQQTEEIKDIVGGEVDKVIDTVNNTLTVPSVENNSSTTDIDIDSLLKLNISDITFDFDNRSYTVNAYDIDYDVTNNYYEYNYYTYNIQYTYNNTYVTYIGSTAEYQPKEWALYYELPDGRSSADLTEEDIAGLSFQFADVVNYKKSATDTSLRALYHFDGNTNDSSYWSTQGSFTWSSGASITYMESNAFSGALYLDEQVHDFTLTLPSALGSGDFSLQWRYYQNSATTSENNDNYLMIGSTKILGWNEHQLFSQGTTKLSTALSVGTWQELAVIRSGQIIYLYHNGVRIGSFSGAAVFNDKITFHFGSASRAYSMLDELRVTNFALVKDGASYTPTSVPYDTNSVLVLPDGAFPISDAYWSIDKTPAITPAYRFNFLDNSVKQLAPSKVETGYAYPCDYWDYSSYIGKSALWYSTKDCFMISDGLSISINSYSPPGVHYSYQPYPTIKRLVKESYRNPFFVTYNSGYSPSGNLLKGEYTLTVLFSDGTSASSVFNVRALPSGYVYMSDSVSCRSGSQQLFLNVYSSRNDNLENIWAQVVSIYGNADVAYFEIVPGNIPNTSHEWITAVYSSEEIQSNTAAVQSDIPINGYTVGGVRPTFPERGDVWFPVEGSRISGVYIYNGQAWEETNARWWTGKRWIPIYAFDLVTLQDMWDVSSSDGSDITPSINSEYGFWNWWKSQWLDFRSWLSNNWSTGTGGSPGGSDSAATSLWDRIKNAFAGAVGDLIESVLTFITEVLKLVLDLAYDLLEFFFQFLTSTVIAGIGGLFAAFTDGSLFAPFQGEGETPGYQLPEGVPAVFAFFSGVILALPGELRTVLIFGIAALVLLAVFKLARS